MALVICMMDARSGWGISTVTDAQICCSITPATATGGLAHTRTSAISCSGASQATRPGSARYGTGAPSGLATLTGTDAPMCCFITQEIATGGLAHTPVSADSCSGALRETPLGSVTWQTDGPSGPATSREPTGVRFCSTTLETATGGWGRTTVVSCSGALRETPPGSVRWRTGGPSGWGTSTATDAPISCSTTPATATGGWVPIA